jgi:hypothetical protein
MSARVTFFVVTFGSTLAFALYACGSSGGGGGGTAGSMGAAGSGGSSGSGGTSGSKGSGGSGGTAGSGSVECNGKTCASGSVCVEAQEFGHFVQPTDGGPCPAKGEVKVDGGMCVAAPTYHCAKLPEGCGGKPTCACAKSVCGSSNFVCQSTTASSVSCVFDIP